MTDPDVVVIGGGPAGLAAAIVCAKHGVTTMLIERRAFPIDKPCGEGLLPNGVAALGRIGIDTAMVAANARTITGIRYYTSRGRSAEASFTDRTALGIRRTDLSRLLAAHARLLPDVEIVTGRAELVAVAESRRPLVRVGGNTYRPKLVIGADGLHSRTRDVLGATVRHGRHQRWGCRQHFDGEPWTQHVEVYFQRGFELYLTPMAHGINVAALWDARVVHPTAGDSPVLSLIARVPNLARRLEGRVAIDRARAAGPFDVHVPRPWRAGVLLIGDAAGYVDPLTGEGVGLALEQAALLASTVVPAVQRTPNGMAVEPGALSRFTRAVRARSRSHRQLARLLVRVARYPALVDRIIGVLASNAVLFAHLLDANMGRRGLWNLPIEALGRQRVAQWDDDGTTTRLPSSRNEQTETVDACAST